MPLTVSKEQTRVVEGILDDLLGFVWRQWAQLGVSGDIPFRDHWIIDPEALLLFTLQIGRYDPRLFDEVLDWCAKNGDWLSIQRVKALLRQYNRDTGSEDTLLTRTVGAVASLLAGNEPRWQTLLPTERSNESTEKDGEPFFLSMNGDPLPLLGVNDHHFRKFGFQRAPVLLRGLSLPVMVDAPAGMVLRLRALFGLDPRAEILPYLLTHSLVGTREIARATGYAPASVQTILVRLATGRFVNGSGQKGYEVDRAHWQSFLHRTEDSTPVWVDWHRVLPILVQAIADLQNSGTLSESSYLRASRLLRSEAKLHETLTGSGLPNPFTPPSSLENVSDQLPERLANVARRLRQGLRILPAVVRGRR